MLEHLCIVKFLTKYSCLNYGCWPGNLKYNNMKKVLFASVFGIFFAMGMSSCSKCQVCTKPSEPEARLCKSDYSSETEFGIAVDVKEAQGYDCKSSI